MRGLGIEFSKYASSLDNLYFGLLAFTVQLRIFPFCSQHE